MVIKHIPIKPSAGFNLIEMMVVMAIVAILANIAYSSYQDSVIKSRRADGKHALHLAVTHQEKYYLAANAYSLDMSNIGGEYSLDGFYRLNVENRLADVTCAPTNTSPAEAQCYTLTAEPQGVQEIDQDCKKMVIDSLGRKTASDGSRDTTGTCW